MNVFHMSTARLVGRPTGLDELTADADDRRCTSRMLPSIQSNQYQNVWTYITQLNNVWMIVSHQNLDLFIRISLLRINYLNTFQMNVHTKQHTPTIHAVMHAVLLYNVLYSMPAAGRLAPQPEHVSGAWAADLPLNAQAYFLDTRSPLRGPPLTLRSRSPDFPPTPLTLRSTHML